MHVTEIYIEKQSLDLYSDDSFKYKLQVNKIGSLKDREASFMPATSIPKTAKNKRLLQGLGIPSDTSAIPYLKPNCELRIDGFSFISKGWIGFEESGDEYKVKIYSGIVQFFKSIEGKTLGNDLDLSAINLNKTVKNVIDSFTNPSMRYLIADYNGKTHYGTDDKIINIDYLVPSVNVAYLWDLVHKTFGFTYSGLLFSSSQFNNLWITFPKPIDPPVENEINRAVGARNLPWQNTPASMPETWYKQIENSGFPVGNIAFKAPASGKYRMKIYMRSSSINVDAQAIFYSVNRIGSPLIDRPNAQIVADNWGPFLEINQDRVIDLEAGDLVDFYTRGYFENQFGLGRWDLDFDIKFIQIVDSGANFSEELKDFLITDFMKDLFNTFGLTPFSNEINNNIDYKLITERYATAEVVDWTRKYVRRKDETYIFDAYAKQNFFRWQYNDKGSDYHDGSINIPNLNLEERKDIFKSKMYSPERNLTKFYAGTQQDVNLRVFKMYDKTVKETQGQTKIEYKSLDKRFHYCRSVMLTTTVRIGSETYQEDRSVDKMAVIDYSGLAWTNLLATFYETMGRVLTDSRLHEIELNLDPTDVILLDQSKMVYFEQEQQYYVIDSIEYDGDEVGVGKFIRVKRDPNAVIIPQDPTTPKDYVIPAQWSDGTNGQREGYAKNVAVKAGTISYPVGDPLIQFQWERNTGGAWVTDQGVGPNTSLDLTEGMNTFRIRGITQNGISYYSNELKYMRKTYICRTFVVQLIPKNSGDVLVVQYSDCNGATQTRIAQNHFGQVNPLYISECAIEGTVLHNGTQIVYQNSCQ